MYCSSGFVGVRRRVIRLVYRNTGVVLLTPWVSRLGSCQSRGSFGIPWICLKSDVWDPLPSLISYFRLASDLMEPETHFTSNGVLDDWGSVIAQITQLFSWLRLPKSPAKKANYEYSTVLCGPCTQYSTVLMTTRLHFSNQLELLYTAL